MEEVKINFGCFNRPISGWINVDFAIKYILMSKFIPLCKLAFKMKLISEYNLYTIRSFKGVTYGILEKN